MRTKGALPAASCRVVAHTYGVKKEMLLSKVTF